MNSEEKEISYTTTNSYSTLNTLNTSTKNVWIVCHGMAYLSRYFLKYFKGLNPEENYIIAPQAQSKYYLKSDFKYVGASWLTKENTKAETENVFNYFDAVLENENIPNHVNIILFGYSQGVSVSMRYLASRQLKCEQLIIHSGYIPKELSSEEFAFYNGKTHLICGDKDQYFNGESLELEINMAKKLFKKHLNIMMFDGIHEVSVNLINEIGLKTCDTTKV